MTAEPLDAARARPMQGGASFPLSNRIERALWGLCWFLGARWNPRPLLKGWRRFLLRRFGARIGQGCTISPDVRIWLPRHLTMEAGATLGPGVECYSMAPVHIGERTVISHRAFLCAGSHDPRDPHFQLVTAPIRIGADCWIAAEAFVGPGVTVGDGAVLAARGCAVRDLEGWTVHAGNPAKAVGARRLRDDTGSA